MQLAASGHQVTRAIGDRKTWWRGEKERRRQPRNPITWPRTVLLTGSSAQEVDGRDAYGSLGLAHVNGFAGCQASWWWCCCVFCCITPTPTPMTTPTPGKLGVFPTPMEFICKRVKEREWERGRDEASLHNHDLAPQIEILIIECCLHSNGACLKHFPCSLSIWQGARNFLDTFSGENNAKPSKWNTQLNFNWTRLVRITQMCNKNSLELLICNCINDQMQRKIHIQNILIWTTNNYFKDIVSNNTSSTPFLTFKLTFAS